MNKKKQSNHATALRQFTHIPRNTNLRLRKNISKSKSKNQVKDD